MAPIDGGVCSAFVSLRAAECALCRYFIIATGLKGQAVGMLMPKAKPAWIAFGGPRFQLHKRPKLLVQGMCRIAWHNAKEISPPGFQHQQIQKLCNPKVLLAEERACQCNICCRTMYSFTRAVLLKGFPWSDRQRPQSIHCMGARKIHSRHWESPTNGPCPMSTGTWSAYGWFQSNPNVSWQSTSYWYNFK